jgi:hypothetical protein
VITNSKIFQIRNNTNLLRPQATLNWKKLYFQCIRYTLLKQKLSMYKVYTLKTKTRKKKQIQVQYRNGAKDVLFLESKMFLI